MEQLPNYLRYRWILLVRDIQKKNDITPSIKDQVSFIEDAAEEVNNPVYESVSSKEQPRWAKQRSKGTFAVATETNEFDTKKCFLCKEKHTLFGCQQFKGRKPQDRLNYAKAGGIGWTLLVITQNIY